MTNYRRSWESGLYVKYLSFQSLAPNSFLNTAGQTTPGFGPYQFSHFLSFLTPHVPGTSMVPCFCLRAFAHAVSSAQDTQFNNCTMGSFSVLSALIHPLFQSTVPFSLPPSSVLPSRYIILLLIHLFIICLPAKTGSS